MPKSRYPDSNIKKEYEYHKCKCFLKIFNMMVSKHLQHFLSFSLIRYRREKKLQLLPDRWFTKICRQKWTATNQNANADAEIWYKQSMFKLWFLQFIIHNFIEVQSRESKSYQIIIIWKSIMKSSILRRHTKSHQKGRRSDSKLKVKFLNSILKTSKYSKKPLK